MSTAAQDLKNDITESYCSFEVSKLLKEKGCECQNGRIAYAENGVNCERLASAFFNEEVFPYQTITHALAIEWIRVNFGIHIYIKILINVSEYVHRKVFSPAILEDTDAKMGFITFDSPQDATEAALLYTLKNLIP